MSQFNGYMTISQLMFYYRRGVSVFDTDLFGFGTDKRSVYGLLVACLI
jgi:hypothetical protein